MSHGDHGEELPEGWAATRLNAVTLPVRSVDPAATPSRKFGYVDISAIDNERFRIVASAIKNFSGAQAPSRARRPIQRDDVLFSNVRTYLRNIARVTESDHAELCSTGFTVLRPGPAIDAAYLFRYVLTDAFIDSVTPRQTGTHYPATSDRVVLEQLIPLPPLVEQQRIVARIEELLARVNAAREQLARVPEVFRRYRQSVLAAACSGRLTEAWRLTNREARADVDASRRIVGVHQIDAGDLPPIPETWLWVPLSQLGELNRGKSKHRPRNDPRLYGGTYPFVQTGDISRSGGRISSHSQTYNETGLAQSRLWPKNTVCITIAANIAESALLTYPACFPDSVVGLVVNPAICTPEYAEYFIRTARADLSQYAPATAQKNINLEILRQVAVPLPPLSEQNEIVRRVQTLLSAVNSAGERTSRAVALVDKLTQSILGKAFRGELVPTEAELARVEGRNYETADELLARSDGARGETAKTNGSQRRRKVVSA